MQVKLNENSTLNIPDTFSSKVIASLTIEKDKGVKSISFEDLKLFFLDDEKLVEKYDTTSQGFIHQFLLEKGYEVINHD